MSPKPCDRRPISLAKDFNHVFLCLSHFIRSLCSSDTLVSSSMNEFARIFRYWWSVMSHGILWKWTEISTVPTSLLMFFDILNVLWGIYAQVGGKALPGPFQTSMTNTPFIKMVSGVGVWVLLV